MSILNKATASFSYQLPDLTTQNKSIESNVTTNSLLTEIFTAVKTANKTFALANETIVYTLVLTNSSTETAKNISVKDILSAGSNFLAGSVTINGVVNASADIVAGVVVPDMPTLAVTTIKYSAKVATESLPNSLSSSASISLTINNGVSGDKVYTTISNFLTVTLVKPELTVVKTSDKRIVRSSDQILYTIIITNAGSVKATNVKFIDPVPVGSNFMTGTFKINGSVVNISFADLTTGVALPDINVSDIVTVEFKVVVS